MEPLATPKPRLYRCEGVNSQHNIECFVKWCSWSVRSQEQIEAVLKKVFALRHLSDAETDQQWLHMVNTPRLHLKDDLWMTTLPCKVHPCVRCQHRQGGITFQYIGPWTPIMIVGQPSPVSVEAPMTWQQSAVGQEPWIYMTDGDVRSFELIDPDLRSPLVEDVADDESAETLSSLTEDDEPKVGDVMDC